MIVIRSKKGDTYQYDEETEFIAKNGEIISRTYLEPIYTRAGSSLDIPPEFCGVLDKVNNEIINLHGRISKIAMNEEDSIS